MLHNLFIGELADHLSKRQLSSVELTRHFLSRIERLNPALNAFITLTAEQALKEAAAAGLIGPSEWSEYGKCDERQQHEMWAARAAGELKGRDDVARAGRRARLGAKLTARTNRVRVPLSSGATLTIAAKDLSIDDAVAILSEALREAKRGRDGAQDIRAWQIVMKNKARVATQLDVTHA